MSDHKFPVEVAKDYDVETALLLEFMRFITSYNKSNKRHMHDGSVWVYNSYEAWTEQFPYWSSKQMRRILGNAEDYGLIRVGNYNKRASDLTKWYALTEQAIEYFPELKAQLLNTPAQTGNTPAQTGKTPAQTGSALPDTKPDTNPDIKTTTTGSGSFNPFETQCLEQKLESDTRTEDEFIENVYHHIQNNIPGDKPVPMRRRMILSLLKTLKQTGEQFTSTNFVSRAVREEKEKEKELARDKLLWSAYQGYVNSPIEIALRKTHVARLESFEEWKQHQCIE